MQDILSSMNASLFEGYGKLTENIDALCSKVQERCGHDMRCAERCCSCCIAGLSLFPIEAFHILKQIKGSLNLPESGHEGCIFLKEGLCTIYSFRPVVCRTQGYPLLYESDDDPESLEISCCEMNFTETPSVDSSCLVDMERINTILAALNISFLRATCLEEELRDRRFTMEEIASGDLFRKPA